MEKIINEICGYVEDLIFGHRREKILGKEVGLAGLQTSDVSHPYIETLFCYRNARMKKIIWNIKYKGDRKLTKEVAKTLYENMLEDFGDKYFFGNSEKVVLVPIPACKRRMKEHGFSQCERIVREIEKLDRGNSFETLYDALEKTKDTQSQAHTKSRFARMENLRDSFGVKFPEKISGKNIVLIDDVWTTGTTISEARKVLLGAGAKKVVVYTVAH